MMFVPHKKHTYGPPRPFMGIALLCYMWRMFLPHRNTCMGLHGLLRRKFCFFYFAAFITTWRGERGYLPNIAVPQIHIREWQHGRHERGTVAPLLVASCQYILPASASARVTCCSPDAGAPRRSWPPWRWVPASGHLLAWCNKKVGKSRYDDPWLCSGHSPLLILQLHASWKIRTV
jgi:hypothetical protein